MSVLIIEDNAQLAANLYDYLEACGHRLDAAPDGLTGLHLAATRDYDAIVLDWNLPRLDGLSVLRRLRGEAGARVPVIMLTARDQLDDKLEGFESGTDDYLVKPVALPEIEARLRALVARAQAGLDAGRVLAVADLALNLDTLQASRAGRPLVLSPTGRHLLERLMRDSPRVVSRQRLEQAAWGDRIPEGDLLRSHMHLLRRAIDPDGQPRLLQTVSGVGYRLCGVD
ncbi:response regulator transcription factor [Pseudoxanthomonas sp.]|uniref:response regulator transcription factor n=1 Tax=Pseudoxanthomonas sp. TaxID=1871049 RepID=UPI00258D3AC1|nr:response regulator transcription factor [Pseudoxanthomonas sp.]MCR6684906.1 response regulator transcription factor [Pseudoxanthomonas sp.]